MSLWAYKILEESHTASIGSTALIFKHDLSFYKTYLGLGLEAPAVLKMTYFPQILSSREEKQKSRN